MTQQTLVVKLLGAQQLRLRERLNAGTFEWRKTPHARFSVKGEGAVVTLYAAIRQNLLWPPQDFPWCDATHQLQPLDMTFFSLLKTSHGVTPHTDCSH